MTEQWVPTRHPLVGGGWARGDADIYPSRGAFAVARGGEWLPGHYATLEAAKRAADLSREVLEVLDDLAIH